LRLKPETLIALPNTRCLTKSGSTCVRHCVEAKGVGRMSFAIAIIPPPESVGWWWFQPRWDGPLTMFPTGQTPRRPPDTKRLAITLRRSASSRGSDSDQGRAPHSPTIGTSSWPWTPSWSWGCWRAIHSSNSPSARSVALASSCHSSSSSVPARSFSRYAAYANVRSRCFPLVSVRTPRRSRS
jgi:hypothetical protein